MMRLRGIGRTATALAAILITLGLLAAGCAGIAAKVTVRAVARAAPAVAPFFTDALLASDSPVGEALALGGGTKKGNQPGLYGGTRRKRSCSKAKLVEFLTAPANHRKAKEWAKAQGLDDVDEIKEFVKKLTPVVLRNDILVKNHDFKKGKAFPFDALLEAGIAVLVDQFGKPVVQCSCGNPLDTFDHDIDDAKVKFKGKNKKWKAYDPKKVAKVKPADRDEPVRTYELVDVEQEDAGLARPAGSDGTQDRILPEDPNPEGRDAGQTPTTGETPTTEPLRVPEATGIPADEAEHLLADKGFTVELVEEVSEADTPGTVIAQSPAAGEETVAGSTVTLTVASAGETPGQSPAGPTDPAGNTSPGTGVGPVATADGTFETAGTEGGSDGSPG